MDELLAYPLLTALGMLASAVVWERIHPRDAAKEPERWNALFVGALIGTCLGAKLGYAFAEGLWLARAQRGLDAVLLSFQGKTVLGGLLGAYAGVELAKRAIGHSRPTGDSFALIAPLSLMFGRAGCVLAGCCHGVELPPAWFTLLDAHGVARWPAALVELLFNAALFALVLAWTARRRNSGPSRIDGQLFHLYLIAYGAFRFVHELLRDTPRWIFGWSGYQLLALMLLALGVIRFAQRARTVTAPALLHAR